MLYIELLQKDKNVTLPGKMSRNKKSVKKQQAQRRKIKRERKKLFIFSALFF